MKLIVNGEEREFEQPLTAEGLLAALEAPARRVAMMVNDRIVKRDSRAQTELRDGDRVEIISMVGGG